MDRTPCGVSSANRMFPRSRPTRRASSSVPGAGSSRPRPRRRNRRRPPRRRRPKNSPWASHGLCPLPESLSHRRLTTLGSWKSNSATCGACWPPSRPSRRRRRSAGQSLRIDPGHTEPGRRRSPADHASKRSAAGLRRARPVLYAVAWLVLLIGLMGMACGGVLVGWSLIAGRQDLWPIGLPIALVGQIVLVIGFVLQMDRLWNDHSRTSAKLSHMDERLADLEEHHRPAGHNAQHAGGELLFSFCRRRQSADSLGRSEEPARPLGLEDRPGRAIRRVIHGLSVSAQSA